MTLADVEFNISGQLDEREDILRCLRTLIMTPTGSVPLDRDFGIDYASLDGPINVARNLFAVRIVDKVQKYEPRVSVKEVELYSDINGQIKAKVVITGA